MIYQNRYLGLFVFTKDVIDITIEHPVSCSILHAVSRPSAIYHVADISSIALGTVSNVISLNLGTPIECSILNQHAYQFANSASSSIMDAIQVNIDNTLTSSLADSTSIYTSNVSSMDLLDILGITIATLYEAFENSHNIILIFYNGIQVPWGCSVTSSNTFITITVKEA